MKPLLFLLFLALLGLTLVECETFQPNFENENAIRQIDLRGQIEVVTTSYTVRNVVEQNLQSYILAFAPRDVGIFASLQIYSNDTEEDNTRKDNLLTAEEITVNNDGIPEGTKFFRVDLLEPLEPDEVTAFHVISVFIHPYIPFPAEISQGESQYVIYHGDALCYSLYETTSQRSLFILASKNIEFYTKEEKSHLDLDKIEYGPFSDIEPLSSISIKIHSENNSPFATMRTMVREIEVSHWGNVAVEDSFLLVHNGAKLKNGFSRHDYQQSQQGDDPSFHGIMAHIPNAATDVYYRDQIGNISTSHLRYENDYQALEISPRYPMFGGWKVDFYMGYNLPASEVLSSKKSSSNSYVLEMQFNGPFAFVVYDSIEVRVILPEGATNIKWTSDEHIDSEDSDVRVTYLDTIGRPVLILKKANVVGIPPTEFKVTYSFSQLTMLQEPALIIIAFLAFFFVTIIYVRVDLSISVKKKNRSLLGTRVINLFCENGENMMAAYLASNTADGDVYLNNMRQKLPAIQKVSNRSIVGKLDDLLDTIKKNKKNLGPNIVQKYQQLLKQLGKF